MSWVPVWSCFLVLLPGADEAFIDEFLAANRKVLLDENGEASDWIELHNPGSGAVDLTGWHLTDEPADLAKWRFPATTLGGGGYLVVFASGKDRTVPGSPLHTNFKLDAGGEYLALVRPDGVTVAQEFAPAFPPQRPDIAYGTGQEPLAGKLLAAGAAARALVPGSEVLGLSWTGGGEPFDDSPAAGWAEVTTGLGYDLGSGTARPLLYFDFDEAGDPEVALDESGNEYHGSVTSHFELTGAGGSAKPVYSLDGEGHTGHPGDRALRFGTGEGALVKVPAAEVGALDPATRNDAITLSLWILGGPDQPANDVVFWGSSSPDGTGIRSLNAHIPWSDRTIYWDTAGCCDGTQRIFKLESDPTRWKGQWNHYVLVKDRDRKQIWQNGVLFHEGTNTADLTSIRGLFIGGALNQGPLSYGGLIDDFAVWDQALAAEEIQSLARGASPLALASLSPLIATDLRDLLYRKSASVYLRIPFEVDGSLEFDTLYLRMKYDAGFVAYLNGVEVARRNAPAALRFDSRATAARSPREALVFEDLDLTSSRGLLRTGTNLLAIHGLNDSPDSPDLLLLPELIAARTRPDRYLAPATPGGPNVAGVIDFVADISFSVGRGFFSETFQVEMACATEGAAIYTTTDGSVPGPANPAARLYTGPATISSTTMLRAAAYRAGYQPSDIGTQTYIFPARAARQPVLPAGLPASWSGFPADYGVDPDVVNTTRPGYGFEEALLSIPSVSLVLDPQDLFGATGGIYSNSAQVSERPGSMELIDPRGRRGFQEDAGVRIHGYTSRDHNFTPKHSFRVVFKSQFGASKLAAPLFPDSDVDHFDQVVLRGMSTDSWPVMDGWASPEPGIVRWYREKAQYLREQWMKDSQVDMGNLSTHGIFVHLFLNGLYWGVYNLTERPVDDFNAEHLGGEKEEYDVLKDFAEVQAGNKDAWNQLMGLASAGLAGEAAYQKIQGNNPDGTRNPALPKLLDLDNLIDYMILHIYSRADDWPNHNWWAGRRRGPESRGFKFFSWDQEITNNSLIQTRTSWGPRFEEVGAYDTPSYLYAQLRANPNFRLRFADRVQRHLQNGGALTPEACQARWMRRATEVDRAIVGESARWGDSKRATPYKREVEWLAEQRWLRDTYWKGNHPAALQRFRNVGLYPQLAAPAFNRHGGRVERGFELTIAAAAGTVYFTLDGRDPRLPSGAVLPAARVAGGEPLPIGEPVTVKARALQGATWSPLTEAYFFPDLPLRITEVMYHPAPPPEPSFPTDDFEFIEIQNIGETTIDLHGVRLTGAVEFDFSRAAVDSLAPGRMVVVVRDGEAFAERYDARAVAVAGDYQGELRNSGERILLLGPAGEPLHDFRYSDLWYPETDGDGYSLVIRDVLSDPAAWTDPAAWRPSGAAGGSPGIDESGGPRPDGLQVGGDLNQDAEVNLADPVGLLINLFIDARAAALPCGTTLADGGNLAVLDANADGAVDLTDAVHLLVYLFLGGPGHALGAGCRPVADCPDACGVGGF